MRDNWSIILNLSTPIPVYAFFQELFTIFIEINKFNDPPIKQTWDYFYVSYIRVLVVF